MGLKNTRVLIFHEKWFYVSFSSQCSEIMEKVHTCMYLYFSVCQKFVVKCYSQPLSPLFCGSCQLKLLNACLIMRPDAGEMIWIDGRKLHPNLLLLNLLQFHVFHKVCVSVTENVYGNHFKCKKNQVGEKSGRLLRYSAGLVFTPAIIKCMYRHFYIWWKWFITADYSQFIYVWLCRPCRISVIAI